MDKKQIEWPPHPYASGAKASELGRGPDEADRIDRPNREPGALGSPAALQRLALHFTRPRRLRRLRRLRRRWWP